ncbi:MAG: hypothetical protein U5R49_27655 [Deltaproteobacteria bacterium]|nr:hypothetical protein [Deltaproteobacteria bacterium]
MLQPTMVKEAANLMRKAVEKRLKPISSSITGAGGNAPQIAEKLVEAFTGNKA